jgi:carbonic anhydrase
VQSLENLETFPFVRERMAQGRVQLHGAYFDVASGILQALDPESGTFAPL